MRGEFRQRLIDGAYSIRASGIYQLDKGAYLRADGTPTPGYRDFRGSIETTGQFALSNKWTWGWDGILPTDPTFFQNYGLSTYQRGTNILVNGLTEGVSQLYLAGRGDRSYFDMRAIYYYGFSEADFAEPNSGHPSGDRLQLCVRPAGARRRTQLSSQLDEPEPHPTPISIRSRQRHTPTASARSQPPTRLRKSPPIVCSAAFRAPTPASPARRSGSAASPIPSARCSHRS